jgi:hypothetical protein
MGLRGAAELQPAATAKAKTATARRPFARPGPRSLERLTG